MGGKDVINDDNVERARRSNRRTKMLVVGFLMVNLAVIGGVMYASSASAGAKVEMSRVARTHFYFLLDRSGSMGGVRGDIIGGLNTYVSEQRRDLSPEELDMSYLTLVQFDGKDSHEVHLHREKLQDVKKFGLEDFVPRGSTPLYDAIAKIVERAEKAGEQENKVIIIMTDGEENASLKNNKLTVSKLVSEKSAEGWTFVFLGANIEAFEEADKVGIHKSNTQNFVQDSAGISRAFSSLAKASSAYSKRVYSDKKHDGNQAENFFEGNNDAQRDFEERQQQKPVAIAATTKLKMIPQINMPHLDAATARKSWPSLKGTDVDVAVEKIRSDVKYVSQVVKVPVGSVVTMDHRTDRVRIWYDTKTNQVAETPMIG